jgi:hypothetical protein
MEDNDKTYGFVINIYDSPESIETLWPQTLEFIAEHPEYIHPNNALKWLTDSKNRPNHNHKANGYSTCHFWSNFEIADMNFWRSKKYKDYFDHLDRAGGFFYERWGDAPVHSIALGLFEDKSKIHWFVPHLIPPRASKLIVGIGSVTSATNTSPTSTAPHHQSVAAAWRAASRTVQASTRRTAEQTGLNLRTWIKCWFGKGALLSLSFLSYTKESSIGHLRVRCVWHSSW